MDPGKLLEQFLGGGAANTATDMAHKAKDQFLPQGLDGISGGTLGGVAAGSLLGLLLGSKKVRKMAGGAVGYGGAAVLGALALKAWQTWQEQQQGQPAAQQQPVGAFEPLQLQRLAADGKPFALALIRAMIAAANADGHIGPEEHKTIFEHVNRLGLSAEDKAFIFDALSRPAAAYEIAALANGPEQASEIWLAARMAIDPDDPREQAFLQTLGSSLNLAAGLIQNLEQQIAQAAASPA